jgi:hypothetical protein
MNTDIFALLHAVGDELALALPAAAHVEHAEAVVLGEMLDDTQGFKSTAAQSMQVDDALAVEGDFSSAVALAASMANERALDLLVPSVGDMM